MNDDILTVLLRNDLIYGVRVIWAKLALIYGVGEPFIASRPELAETLKEGRNTFVPYYNRLRWLGAIKTRPIYEKGRMGCLTTEFTLIRPSQWKPIKPKALKKAKAA